MSVQPSPKPSHAIGHPTSMIAGAMTRIEPIRSSAERRSTRPTRTEPIAPKACAAIVCGP